MKTTTSVLLLICFAAPLQAVPLSILSQSRSVSVSWLEPDFSLNPRSLSDVETSATGGYFSESVAVAGQTATAQSTGVHGSGTVVQESFIGVNGFTFDGNVGVSVGGGGSEWMDRAPIVGAESKMSVVFTVSAATPFQWSGQIATHNIHMGGFYSLTGDGTTITDYFNWNGFGPPFTVSGVLHPEITYSLRAFTEIMPIGPHYGGGFVNYWMDFVTGGPTTATSPALAGSAAVSVPENGKTGLMAGLALLVIGLVHAAKSSQLRSRIA